MPVYQYEAMDNTGLEVKDTIDAPSEAEAQTLIREKDLLVTRIAEKGRKRKKGKAADRKKMGGKKRSFTIGGVKSKNLCTFTRQLSILQDAGLPILFLDVEPRVFAPPDVHLEEHLGPVGGVDPTGP